MVHAQCKVIDFRNEKLLDEYAPSMETANAFPFDTPWKYQLECLEAIIREFCTGKEFVMVEAPTGTGKTPIAGGAGRFYNTANILTSTKQLQNQYLNQISMSKSVKGRGNFGCLLANCKTDKAQCRFDKDFYCIHAPDSEGEKYAYESYRRGSRFWNTDRHCPYWEQKADAIKTDMVVHNFAYYLYESNFAGDFGPRGILVCDEGHNAERQIMGFYELSLSERVLKRYGMKFPLLGLSNHSSVQKWLSAIENIAEQATIVKMRSMDKRVKTAMEELIENIMRTHDKISSNPKNWVANFNESTKDLKVSFKPIRVREYASGALFEGNKRNLLLSATFLDPDTIMESLGIDPSKCTYITLPSTFPIENRPIYVDTVGSMAWKNIESTLPRLCRKVDEIISKYPNDKGLIHTASYKVQQAVIDSEEHIDRMLWHENAWEREDKLNRFMESEDPLVMVSPSFTEGIDLVGDMCRFQIICKLPYPSLGDKQIKARMDQDQRWYRWMTLLTFIQSCGRGVRNKDDHCDTYVLDGSVYRLLKEAKKADMLPDWFADAIVPDKMLERLGW